MTNALRQIESTNDALVGLLGPARLSHVIDIGANPIDGDAPYKQMLERRACRVTGFDPHPQALARLNATKGDLETYLPFAVGDGTRHTLKICRGIGFASLLQPDEKTLSHFPRFTELGRVIGESAMTTQRLDDIAEIGPFDLLKIDIQGSELTVFQNGRKKLATAIAVHTEVSFVPLYKNQPVFGDVDLELRSQGFVPHMFASINRKMIAPMVPPDPAAAFNQLVEADVVYVRNFIEADAMDVEQLKHLALVAHHCYGSFDLAANCLHHLTRRKAIAADASTRYLALIQSGQPVPARASA